MDAKQVGECIRRNMNKKNMSTAMLSALTGIPEERLKEYLDGNLTNKAKYGEIMAISNAIEVPPLMLLHGGDQWHKYGKDEDGRTFSEWIEYKKTCNMSQHMVVLSCGRHLGLNLRHCLYMFGSVYASEHW